MRASYQEILGDRLLVPVPLTKKLVPGALSSTSTVVADEASRNTGVSVTGGLT